MTAISFREGRRAKQMPGRVSRVRGPQRCPEIAAAAGQPLPSRALTSQNTQPLKHPGIAHTQRIKSLLPPPHKTNMPQSNHGPHIHTRTFRWMFTAALFIRVRNLKQPKCPSTGEWIKRSQLKDIQGTNNKNEEMINAHSIRDKSQLCWVKKRPAWKIMHTV